MSASSSPPDANDWRRAVAPYRSPSPWGAYARYVSTWAAFLGAWWLAMRSIDVSWALVGLLDVLVALLAIRLFIFQHDAGHHALFETARQNHLAALPITLLTLTPFEAWRRDHAIHHACTGNLDERGVGDIMLWTRDEFAGAHLALRWFYRAFRHPLWMIGTGPVFLFVFVHRLPAYFAEGLSPRARRQVHLTGVLGFAVWALIAYGFGWRAMVFVHLPACWLGGAIGIFLFYIQHQFEDAYWRPKAAWDHADASLKGATHLELGPVLRWFTGDIGLHHLHHLAPRIPFYKLRTCLTENPQLQAGERVTWRSVAKAFRVRVIDDDTLRLTPFQRRRREAGWS